MKTNFTQWAAIGLALCLTGIGHARAADAMDALYGNTVVVSAGAMGQFKTAYAKDGTYTTTGPMGALSGGWSVTDGQLCRMQTKPAPPPQMANPRCEKLEPHKVGDTWSIDAMGQKFTATLVAGEPH